MTCKYKLDCYAFSSLDERCLDEGEDCRMANCYENQTHLNIIKQTGTDEDLQIEMGDMGLVNRVKIWIN